MPDAPRSRRRSSFARTCAGAATLLLAGCTGPLSALDPAGVGAAETARLWWVLLAGAAVIWTVVIGIAVYAVWVRPKAHDVRLTRMLIIGGGAIVPTVVLAALLAWSLSLMPRVMPPIPRDGLSVHVVGERWWWRMVYLADGREIPVANEFRMPVGEKVAVSLASPDVIHSFWIPALAGKLDMIPGRTNEMVLEATRTGVFRGACAEYCGTSHALMSFAVEVMEPAAFASWLEAQAADAAPPPSAAAARGADLFLAYGCGACHAVRGTAADGRIGPDLTHVGSRLTLGAGILGNEVADFELWIAATHDVKPGVLMPEFGMLPAEDVTAIATYLEGLK